MVFKIDPSLKEPLVVHQPYYHEFIKPVLPKLVQAPKPKPTVSPKPNQQPKTPKAGGQRDYGQGEIQDLIRRSSAQYGIDPETPLCIAKKESGFNPNSANKSSSARGVFQYLSSTWKATDEGKAGYSVYDPEQNIKAAIKYMASRGNAKPWVVEKSCPPVTRTK